MSTSQIFRATVILSTALAAQVKISELDTTKLSSFHKDAVIAQLQFSMAQQNLDSAAKKFFAECNRIKQTYHLPEKTSCDINTGEIQLAQPDKTVIGKPEVFKDQKPEKK